MGRKQMDNQEKVRIGEIKYTNVWPIFYHFPADRFNDEIELTVQVPTTLNRAIAAGEIDMGPISSFAYGENFEDYVLSPDLSVSAFGPVNSILLFHREPLETVFQGRIMLPTTSATSVNLLKIIAGKFYGANPEYEYAAPNLDDMMEKADGALLIGDDAIRGDWNRRGYRVTDLGELWNQHTGNWMTFAVWAVRKQTIERHADLVDRLYRAFLESKVQGLRDPSGMAAKACAEIGGTPEYWKGYFAGLCYDFNEKQWAGLQLYFQYAYELGLVDKPVQLQIWKDKTVVQVNE
jgi:chorismate dehydratase